MLYLASVGGELSLRDNDFRHFFIVLYCHFGAFGGRFPHFQGRIRGQIHFMGDYGE